MTSTTTTTAPVVTGTQITQADIAAAVAEIVARVAAMSDDERDDMSEHNGSDGLPLTAGVDEDGDLTWAVEHVSFVGTWVNVDGDDAAAIAAALINGAEIDLDTQREQAALDA